MDKEGIYSISRYRSGSKHRSLGPKLPRKLEPRGAWRYQAPVVCLIGQKTMSSAESLALMMAQCPQVTTMGDRTAGSSANPRRLKLPGSIIANLPRWLDLDPDGKPIDAVGVAPKKAIATPNYASFKASEPVMEAALKHLKAVRDRKAGKRN